MLIINDEVKPLIMQNISNTNSKIDKTAYCLDATFIHPVFYSQISPQNVSDGKFANYGITKVKIVWKVFACLSY